MDTGQFILVSAVIFLGALLLLGGAVIGLRSRRQSQSETDDPSAPAQVEAPPAVDAGELPGLKRGSPSRFSDWQRKLPPDVIVLSRDAATDEWLVEIEGQRYRRLSDIHDDKAATKIASAIDGLKAFAGIVALETPAPASSRQLDMPTALTQSEPSQPPTAPRRAGQATYPAPQGSIIAQIETILQRELSLRPELSHRTVHMGALPDGSLVIEVDVDFYRSPDEIPDPRVRDVVMFAVRTWEKSS